MADEAFPKLLARRRDAGPQEVGTRDRRRAVRVTVANASDRERAASEEYSIFRRNPAADSLQVQRRGSTIQFMVGGSRDPGPLRRQFRTVACFSFLPPPARPASARR